LRKAGTRDDADAAVRANGLRDLVPEQSGLLLEALAEPHHRRRLARDQQARQHLAQARHRGGDDDEALCPMKHRLVETRSDAQPKGEIDARQVSLIAASLQQLARVSFAARPQHSGLPAGNGHGDGRAPCAGAEDADVHGLAGTLG
jgi:hypothetical protein